MQSRDKDALDRHIMGNYGEGLVECPECLNEFFRDEGTCPHCGWGPFQLDPDAGYDRMREAHLFDEGVR